MAESILSNSINILTASSSEAPGIYRKENKRSVLMSRTFSIPEVRYFILKQQKTNIVVFFSFSFLISLRQHNIYIGMPSYQM